MPAFNNHISTQANLAVFVLDAKTESIHKLFYLITLSEKEKKMTYPKFLKTFLALLGCALVLSGVVWMQTLQSAQAMPPAQEATGLTISLVGPSEVVVGDTFNIDVVAENIPDPGIFGYQLVFNWQSSVFSITNTSPISDFSVLAVNDLGESTYTVAASRQGDVEDLTGPLTLMTIEVQANAVTDPDAASFSLSDVKLGRKGGVDVPVDQLVGLDVVVVEDTNQGGAGDIDGNVTVEGRAEDNQAGHTVTVDDGAGTVMTGTTEFNGDFLITDVLSGTYEATANSDGFLKAVCSDVAHTDDALTTLQDVTLLAGDIDDSGEIDVTDAVAIGLAFNTTDAVSDLNGDGIVDVLDLILMAVNYGQTSDGNPWNCQAAG